MSKVILILGLGVAALAAVAGAGAQETERGEQILSASCQGCHDLRPVQTASKTRDEWTATIEAKVKAGADVKAEDRPILIDFLAVNHGPLPNGRGKAIVLNTCTMCHDLKRIRLGHRSPEEWEETLISMLNEGAPLSDDEFPVVLNYLARNFAH
jgi:cytochrome c5